MTEENRSENKNMNLQNNDIENKRSHDFRENNLSLVFGVARLALIRSTHWKDGYVWLFYLLLRPLLLDQMPKAVVDKHGEK